MKAYVINATLMKPTVIHPQFITLYKYVLTE